MHYLSVLQQAIIKSNENISKINTVSSKYIPRGMGLFSGEQYRKTTFYVYQNEITETSNECNVIIQIKGPYGSYGQAVIKNFFDNSHKIPKDINIARDASFRTDSISKNSFVKSFAKSLLRYREIQYNNNIGMEVVLEQDRAKIIYLPRNHGMYEINMVANGELLKG